MSAVEGDRASAHYWVGYLWGGLREALIALDTGPAAESARRALDEFESSSVHRPREVVGFMVLDATGDTYAYRTSYEEAVAAREQGIDYLLSAESCGHSLAVPWVAKRLPLRIISVDATERDHWLEDGTPVLDREP